MRSVAVKCLGLVKGEGEGGGGDVVRIWQFEASSLRSRVFSKIETFFS